MPSRNPRPAMRSASSPEFTGSPVMEMSWLELGAVGDVQVQRQASGSQALTSASIARISGASAFT